MSVTLHCQNGSSKRGYSVLLDFRNTPELKADRSIIDETLNKYCPKSLIQNYRPQILLGKIFQSPDKRTLIESSFSRIIPTQIELGAITVR